MYMMETEVRRQKERCPEVLQTCVGQMTRLYSFLWEQFSSHKEDILRLFRYGESIFVPLHFNKDNQVVQRGGFYGVGRVCWDDPTNTLGLLTFDEETKLDVPVTPLSGIYHSLHDFFVRECCVQEKPSFDGYLEALREVAAQQSPSAALSHVMEVFNLWSLEISRGNVEPSEIFRWKRRLEEVESCIFATNRDRWVSLNRQQAVVCICDDEKLGKEFEEFVGRIHFILMTDDDLRKVCKKSSYQKTDKWTLQPLVQALQIPKLSEVVQREVIKYGLHDGDKIETLIHWVLPYAQRYLKHHHFDQYSHLQEIGITEVFRRLRFIAVDQLYFQYSLRNSAIRSKKKTHCTCILEGNTLHVVEDFVNDYCNIFAEFSRLLFSGKSNLAVANFLHLITLMASSGSREIEVENFIRNVQGIEPIMEGDTHWTLQAGAVDGHPGSPSGSAATSAGYYLNRHVPQRNLKKKGARSLSMVGWPPSTWKPRCIGEGFTGSTNEIGQGRNKAAVLNPLEEGLQVDGMTRYSSSFSLPVGSQNEADPMKEYENIGGIAESSAVKYNNEFRGEAISMASECAGKQLFIQDDQDVPSLHRSSYAVSTEGDTFNTEIAQSQLGPCLRMSQVLQDPCSVKEACSRDVQEVAIDSPDLMLVHSLNVVGPSMNFQGRDFLGMHPVNEQQRELTGRSGEAFVFQYLTRHYGPAHVKWLNQESESGAAYDILITKESGQREFVEVKATRSVDKDWFEISPREWEFAKIHAESFSIMRVFLGTTNQQIRLLRLPNPVRLARDHVLQLALLLPAVQSSVLNG